MGQQACCSNPITNNVNIAIDPELKKPVLELIAQNLDSPACKAGKECHKYVRACFVGGLHVVSPTVLDVRT
jgi:hypothetical protein